MVSARLLIICALDLLYECTRFFFVLGDQPSIAEIHLTVTKTYRHVERFSRAHRRISIELNIVKGLTHSGKRSSGASGPYLF